MQALFDHILDAQTRWPQPANSRQKLQGIIDALHTYKPHGPIENFGFMALRLALPSVTLPEDPRELDAMLEAAATQVASLAPLLMSDPGSVSPDAPPEWLPETTRAAPEDEA